MKNNELHYQEPNPNIIQEFIDLQEIYPPIHTPTTDFDTVKAWLKIIKIQGFSQKTMQEVLIYIYKLFKKNKHEEAILLLLVCAATKDDQANYLLARELFKGRNFCTNYPASFGIFSMLSEKGHYEALCDLAHFYKNGITIKQNKKQAKKLYKIAMDAGIVRAKKNYHLLNKHPFNVFT